MPVYYLLMLSFFLMLAIKPYLGAPWLDQFLFKDMMPLWTYPLFVQNFAQSLDGGDGGARWVASTWSLAIEEQFYLMLPPLIYFISRRSVASFAAICVVIALFVRARLWQTTGSWFTGYFLLPGRMDALAFGLLATLAIRHAPTLAWLQRSRRMLDALAIGLVLFLTSHALPDIAKLMPETASFIIRSEDFSFRAALFAYAILRVFLVPEQSWYRRFLIRAPLVFTGIVSYSLYMYHPAINGLLFGMVFGDEPKIPDIPHFLVALVVIAVSFALAWLSTTYFEMPIRRWAHQVRYRAVPARVEAS
jgi:peptidoglycan/LPS O-acetylase OafA/YrhL